MDVNKNSDKPNAEAVLFKNFSDEDFVGRWDSVNFSFPAGREVYVEAYKALHFAKHLVDREIQKMIKLNKEGKEVPRTVNDPMRHELEAKALPAGMKAPEPEETPELPTDIDPSESVMNKNKKLEKEEKPPKVKPKDISELREIYESLHPEGKKPFPGWGEKQLLEKIEAFKAGRGDAEGGFEGA